MLHTDPIQSILKRALGEQPASQGSWLFPAIPIQREQGWKLHVSATIISAAAVLERVLPILTTAGVAFKVVANLAYLSDLNQGDGGLSQVGKFITIYPTDDLQAVQLALEIDQATDGLVGPRIPSDRPLRPGSLLHYRFGGFRGLEITDSLGQKIPAIRDPDGKLVADLRVTRFVPPAWVDDPFEAAGVVQHAPEPTSPLFAERYLILRLLHQNAKGGVYLALDSLATPPQICVLKEARRHLSTDPSGRDVCERLRYQYDVLQQLAPDPAFPTVYRLFEREGNLYLAMEYIEGQTIQDLVVSRQQVGERLSAPEIAAIGSDIAAVADRLHQRGWILRDLTPTNVIVTAAKDVRLIDLELVHASRDHSPAYGWGTPGYISPQQAQRQAPTAADDIYALGATLYFLATASDPAFLPEGAAACRQAISLLNPQLPAPIANAISTCMASQPCDRPQDMATLSCRLTGLPSIQPARTEPLDLPMKSREERCHHFLTLARSAGDLILAKAQRQPDGLCWASTATTNQPEVRAAHLPRLRFYPPYLHTGTAGTAMFLADLGSITQDERYTAASEEAGRWLLAYCDAGHDMLPGLHFGEAGIAAFLCRLAEVSGKSSYLERASNIAAHIPPARTDIPDLTHGWAGIGLLHLSLAASGAGAFHLEYARAAGEALAASAEPAGPGFGWRHPPGQHSGLSGEMLTGFAHGAAGIGYFLLELWRATGEDRYHELAAGAARWLSSCADPCLSDSTGCNWPLAQVEASDASRWFYWCHGAAGINHFFLHALELTGNLEYQRLAMAAARTIAQAGRLGGGTLCHGLAGNGSMLIKAYQILQDPTCLEEAFTFGDLLDLYARREERGISWFAEHPGVVTPDYMVGYAGTAAFLLRLATPDQRCSPLKLPVI